jgi:hypothetical protein
MNVVRAVAPPLDMTPHAPIHLILFSFIFSQTIEFSCRPHTCLLSYMFSLIPRAHLASIPATGSRLAPADPCASNPPLRGLSRWVQRSVERQLAGLGASYVVAPPPIERRLRRPAVGVWLHLLCDGDSEDVKEHDPEIFVSAICQFISLITNRSPLRQPPPRWDLSPLQPTTPSDIFYNHRQHVDSFNSRQPIVESKDSA